TDTISEIHANGCCGIAMVRYVVRHTKSRSEQKIGASEHSTKRMHTSEFASSHRKTAIAPNGPIPNLKFMPTDVVALLWPGMWWGSPKAGPSRRLGLVSIQLSKCTPVSSLCRIG